MKNNDNLKTLLGILRLICIGILIVVTIAVGNYAWGFLSALLG